MSSSSSAPASPATQAPSPVLSADPRLPPYFPRSPKQCAPAAKTFFDAFTADGVYTGPPQAPDVGREALRKHTALLQEYVACCSKNAPEKERELYRAPVAYTSQLGTTPASLR